MIIIDTHCHLQKISYENIKNINYNSSNYNLRYSINSATSFNDWDACLGLQENFPQIKTALGVHPWFIEKSRYKCNSDEIMLLNESIAIGEIGLDKKNTNIPLNIQIDVFEYFLKLAKDLNKPVIIHCVGAYNELILSLKKIGVSQKGGIIHSFNHNLDLAKQLLKYNLYFSFGKIFNRPLNNKKIELFKYLFPDYFLLESDIFPSNNPSLSKGILYPNTIFEYFEKASQIINVEKKILAEQTSRLALKIFDLHL